MSESEPLEVDLDEEIDPDKIIKEAKVAFRFSDKLQGFKHRTGRVLVFTDSEAVDAFAALNQRMTMISDRIGRIKPLVDDEATRQAYVKQLEELTAEYNSLDPKLDELKIEMMKSGVAIHFQGYPNIAMKVARKKTRKKFHDDAVGGVPADAEEEAQEYLKFLLMGQSIVKIVNSAGEVDTLASYVDKKTKKKVVPRDTIGQEMSDQLPPSQWARVEDAYTKVTLTDQIGAAATDDPGF
jgi:hypothetical protein